MLRNEPCETENPLNLRIFSAMPHLPSASASPFLIRLLNLLDALRLISPFSSLTAEEEQLLNRLVLRWNSKDAFSVGDIMREELSASPSTVYRRLMGLRDKGLAEIVADAGDKRVKYITPTASTDEYIRKLNLGLATLWRGEPSP